MEKMRQARREHRELRNKQINSPLFDGRGAWRDLLPPEAAAEFERGELGDFMGLFGYLD